MAGGWSWHLASGADLIADLSDARSKSATWKLTGPGTASFILDGDHPVAALVQELVTDMVVSFDGNRLWRGRIGPSGDDADGTRSTVKFDAIDYRGLMERRLTTTDSTRTMKPSDAAWAAIDTLQSRTAGAMGITRGAIAPGSSRVLAAEFGETLAALIDRWSTLYPGGFDWWVDGNLLFQTDAGRGGVVDWALVYGETVTGFTRQFDPSTYANVIRASGADGVTPAVAEAADLATRPEARWETQVGDTNLTTTAEVQGLADAELIRRSTLAPDYSFQITPGTWDPNRAWIGDLPAIGVRTGRLDVTSVDRITEITVADNDTGSVDVSITTGSELRRNLSQLIRRQSEQITVLTRR